jgi:hypothetical protein
MRWSKSIGDGLAGCAALLTYAILFPGAAEAYVGPGSGLAALGTLVALLGAVLLGIFGFMWFPIKRMLRRKRKDDPSRVKETETKTP